MASAMGRADCLVSEYRPLKEDTDTPQASSSDDINKFLETLSGDGPGALSDDQIESIRLCCRFALEITPQQIESLLETSFSNLFGKGIRVSKVVTGDDTEDGAPNHIDPEDLLYFMLERLGYNMTGLPRSAPNDNNVYKQIDMILSLATTVTSMSENDYNKFKRFHTEQKNGILPSLKNIKHHCDLVGHLLEKKPLHKEEDISIVFDWLQVSGCSNHQQKLQEYCKRHHIKFSTQVETCECYSTINIFIWCEYNYVNVFFNTFRLLFLDRVSFTYVPSLCHHVY